LCSVCTECPLCRGDGLGTPHTILGRGGQKSLWGVRMGRISSPARLKSLGFPLLLSVYGSICTPLTRDKASLLTKGNFIGSLSKIAKNFLCLIICWFPIDNCHNNENAIEF
jgi:hypothetical protein